MRGRSDDMLDENAVRALLREACDAAGSQRAWAMRHKLNPAYVSDALAGARAPGPAIYESLGLEKVVRYRRRRQRAAAE